MQRTRFTPEEQVIIDRRIKEELLRIQKQLTSTAGARPLSFDQLIQQLAEQGAPE